MNTQDFDDSLFRSRAAGSRNFKIHRRKYSHQEGFLAALWFSRVNSHARHMSNFCPKISCGCEEVDDNQVSTQLSVRVAVPRLILKATSSSFKPVRLLRKNRRASDTSQRGEVHPVSINTLDTPYNSTSTWVSPLDESWKHLKLARQFEITARDVQFKKHEVCT